jgi:hypothetical protein
VNHVAAFTAEALWALLGLAAFALIVGTIAARKHNKARETPRGWYD